MLERGIKLLPLQGVTNERALTQGVASLALGWALLGFQPVLTKSETNIPKSVILKNVLLITSYLLLLISYFLFLTYYLRMNVILNT